MIRDDATQLFQEIGWIAYGKREVTIEGMLPDIMTVETTSICNLRCVFCPYDEMTRKKGHMSLANFENFIEDQCGHISSLGLHHFGEPFLNPELPKFIEACARRGIRSTVSSNMTHTNQKISEAVLNSGLNRLIVSIDAFHDNTYDRIRLRGDLRKVVSNTINFAKLKKTTKSTCHIEVQFIVTPENINEKDAFCSFWSTVDGINQVTIRDERTHAGQRIRHESYVSRDGQRLPCRYLWESLVILRNGDVVPCCKDFDGKMVLGNVFDGGNSLASIWNGEKMTALRKQHVEQNWTSIPLCKNCNEWPGHIAMNELSSRSALYSFRSSKSVGKTTAIKVRDYE
jgi:radical SAM protein with 4Fe4S-binding SPASM domain